MTNQQTAAAVNAINISDVLRGIGRRWKMIALLTLAFVALGLLIILLSKPLYTAEAQLLLKYQDSPYTRANINVPMQPRQVSDRELKSQVAVLKSRDLALKVIRKLKLAGTAEFDALKRGVSLPGRLKILLGFAPDPARQTIEQRALTTWYKRLKVYNIPQSKIIVIEYSSHNPQIAAAVANTLAALYKASQSRKTGEARDWLKEQIGRLTREVEALEKQASQYRARKGLFKGAQSSLSNQELSELSSQIIKAASERSHAQARARAIREMLRRTGSLDASAEVLKSRLIQRLREQQSRLQRRLAELSTTYLENHPKVRAVRRELAGLKRQIRSEALKIAASLEQQAKIAASREAALRASFAKLKAKVSTASIDEVKLRDLERQAKSKRSLLETYLIRYGDAEARDRKIAQLNTVHVISPADVPVMPSFPKPGQIMILAILAGLVLGLGLAFIIEVMGAVSRMNADAGAQPAQPQVPPQPVLQPQSGAMSSQTAPASARKEEPRPMPLDSTASAGPAMTATANLERRTRGTMPSRAASRDAGMRDAAPEPAPAGEGNAKDVVFALPAGIHGQTDAKTLAMLLASAEGAYSQLMQRLAGWMEANRGGLSGKVTGFASLGGLEAEAAAASLALGRLFAARGLRVIVADADMRAASLDKAVGPDDGKGLSDLLCGQASFVDIIKRDQLSALHVIHAGKMRQAAAARIGQPVMEAVIGALSETYDVILLNDGEIRFPADTGATAALHCGAMVIACRQQDMGAFKSLSGALRNKGVDEIACLQVTSGDAHRSAPQAAMPGVQAQSAGSGPDGRPSTDEPPEAVPLRAASLF